MKKILDTFLKWSLINKIIFWTFIATIVVPLAIQFMPKILNSRPDIIPRIAFNENIGVYSVDVINQGNAVSRNLRVKLEFNRTITDVDLKMVKVNRINIIEGGRGANFVSFQVIELLPGEQQYFTINAQGKTFDKAEAWSESQGNISEKIINFTYSISYGAEERLKEF